MQSFVPLPFYVSSRQTRGFVSRQHHCLIITASTPPVSPHHTSSQIPRTSPATRKPRPRKNPARPSTSDVREPSKNHEKALQQRARIADNLNTARTNLRRQTGNEPHFQETIAYAQQSDESFKQRHEHVDWDDVFSARNQITVKWLWLVTAIARNLYRTYTKSFPEMRAAICENDLVQEGVCGLMQAVERYDPNRGYPFDGFAFYTIKFTIIRAVQNQSRPIRLPIHVLEKLGKMRKVREELEMNQCDISVDTLAKRTGVSKKAAELYLARSNITISIDAPMNPSAAAHAPERPGSLRDFLVDHSVNVAREVERSCTREAVAQLVNSTDLLELERSVLFLKYGLGDGIERYRTEVSRILDMRVHNVRRAELSALKKLRHTIGTDIAAWTEYLS